MKQVLYVLIGVLSGFFLAGAIFLISRLPSGETVALMPAPTPAPIVVDIRGAIPRPGVYEFAEGARVRDAVEQAGGLLVDADPSILNLAAPLEDGQLLEIPYLPGKEPTPSDAGSDTAGSGTDDGSTTEFSVPSNENSSDTGEEENPDETSEGDLIDINSATLEELDTLPGIGPTTAQNIIDYRDENGPFFSIEEIMNVPGIGPATFEDIMDLITVGEVE